MKENVEMESEEDQVGELGGDNKEDINNIWKVRDFYFFFLELSQGGNPKGK